MNKYIDADRLKAEIKRIMSRAMNKEGQDVCNYILSIIDSSQKYSLPEWEEHPEATNNIAMVWNDAATPWLDWRGHRISVRSLEKLPGFDSLQQEQPCDTCTNDKGCVTCKDGELWEGKEQPSEDLEAEIGKVFFSRRFEDEHGRFSIQLSLEEFSDIAEHFYELGKQSKKDLPEWKRAYAGTHFGEDVVTISPKGKDFPRVVETALTDCLYIPISELMKLARNEQESRRTRPSSPASKMEKD